jgi:hypothetical protein
MTAFTLTETEGGGGGFREFIEYTASDTFVVPAGIFTLRVLAQGGGGNGNVTTAAGGGGGGGAGSCNIGHLQVHPAQSLNITVGGANGDSTIDIGGVKLVIAKGGTTIVNSGSGSTGGSPNAQTLMGGTLFLGGRGGNGSTGTAQSGSVVEALGVKSSTTTSNITTFSAVTPATGGTGGGGGSSYFGAGGNGGTSGGNGEAATSFGAGGGGAGVSPASGGAGGAGVIQIWY